MDRNKGRSFLDKVRFFGSFLRSPLKVGSVVPSSRFLVKKVINEIDWDRVNTVVELGAGTGVVTQAIVREKNKDCQAVIFEQDRELRRDLVCRFPELVFRSNAADLHPILKDLGMNQVDTIISALPFANFPQELRSRILDGVIQSLKPGGLFITFQYSFQMKKQLQEYFSSTQLSFVLRNIPPAIVYVCRKSSADL